MKKLIRNISLFDAISTFMVLAVLSAMLFVGTTERANAATEISPYAAALLTNEDCLDDINCDSQIRATVIRVLNYLLTFVGLIAVVFIIYAGFLMMTAGGEEERIESGKKIIIWSAVGILVILFAYVIVNFVIGVGQGADIAV